MSLCLLHHQASVCALCIMLSPFPPRCYVYSLTSRSLLSINPTSIMTQRFTSHGRPCIPHPRNLSTRQSPNPPKPCISETLPPCLEKPPEINPPPAASIGASTPCGTTPTDLRRVHHASDLLGEHHVRTHKPSKHPAIQNPPSPKPSNHSSIENYLASIIVTKSPKMASLSCGPGLASGWYWMVIACVCRCELTGCQLQVDRCSVSRRSCVRFNVCAGSS